MLDVLTAALLVLGLGYCLARLRNPKHFTLVIWIVSVLALGGVFTNDPPYWPHLAITLPAVVVVAGLATVQVWESLTRPMGRVRAVGHRRATRGDIGLHRDSQLAGLLRFRARQCRRARPHHPVRQFTASGLPGTPGHHFD